MISAAEYQRKEKTANEKSKDAESQSKGGKQCLNQ